MRWKICRNLIFIVWILHSFEIIDRQTRRRWCPLFYCYFIDFFLFYYFLFLVVSRDINCRLTSRSSGPPFFLWPFIVGSQTETIRYAVCAVVAHFWSPSSSKRSSPLFISFVLLIFSVRLIYSSSSSSTFSSFFFLPSRRQWKCRNRKPKEGKTKIWPTFGISSGLVLFLSRQ